MRTSELFGVVNTRGMEQNPVTTLRFRLPLDPARLLRARQRIRDYLDEHDVADEVGTNVVLAIEEAMTNAVRHSEASSGLWVTVGFDGGDLVAEVGDDGRGFDTSAFDPDRVPDPLEPGGRGLYLIAHMMDEMGLTSDGGVRVRMLKHQALGKQESAATASGIPSVSLRSHHHYRALRERSLLEEIPEGFVALDWQYRFTYANQLALSLYHLTAEKVIGASIWDLFPGIEDNPLGTAVREAMEVGTPAILDYESPYIARVLEFRIYPTSSGVSLYLRDIEERKRKELAHDESRRRAELLAATAARLLSAADPQAVVDDLCRDVMEHLHCHVFFNYLVDEQAGCLKLNAYAGIEAEAAQAIQCLDFGVAVCGCAALEAHRIVAEDIQHTDDPRAELVRSFGVQAYAAHPLMLRDEVIGTLSFGAKDRTSFTDQELSLMATVADHVAIALDRQRTQRALWLEEARQRQELETSRILLEATKSLVSRRSLGSVLDTLADLALRLTEHRRATVSLWDEAAGELEVAASKGGDPLVTGMRVPVAGLSAPAREAMESRTPRLIDYEAVPPGARGVADEVASRLALDVPLLYQDRLLGMLAVDDGDERREFKERDVALAEGIASEAAVAIENARLLAAESERARLAETLTEIDGQLRSSLDRREMMRRAVAGGTRVIGADSGAINVHSGREFVVEYAYGFPEDPTGQVLSDELERHSLLALETRQPVLVEDVATDARVDARHLLSYGIGAVIVVPLILAGDAVANLFFNFAASRRFTPAEVEFARRLGASLSLALENARLYEEQQRIATTLQENLIHPLPPVEGLELAVQSRPANEPELVGGDFSDVFLLPDGQVMIVIGDVAGKGIRAAGLTETVRSTVRAFASIDGVPAFILRRANQLLLRHEPGEPHVTAFLCVLDPRTGHLSAASAGHPAPVHLSPFSCRIWDVPYGPPLGTFESDYASAYLQLTPEDCLVFYTDGVTEARRDGEMLGEARLTALVARQRSRSAAEVAQAVADEALAFGGRLRDDLHVVVVRLA